MNRPGLGILLCFTTLLAHGQQWNRTYGPPFSAEASGSVIVEGDSTYTTVYRSRSNNDRSLCVLRLNPDGDTIWSNSFYDPSKAYHIGVSGNSRRTISGKILFGGAVIVDSLGPQSFMALFGTTGDTLWTYTMGGTGFENLNQVWENPDGTLSGFGLQQDGVNSMFHLKLDSMGNFLSIRYYAQPGGANCMSGRRTQDGGYILSGSNTPQNGNSQLALLKTNAQGNLLWTKTYGSPWNDNVAFVDELPNGNLILAGSFRTQQTGFYLTGFLAELESDGDTIWTKTSTGPYQNFFTRAVILSDGYTIAGSAIDGPITIGMLHRTDLQGNELWRRTYKTQDVHDHYFYDVRATLDGGFIMAGSTFDSLLVSQDAWLVKVDSFGCLVPGCQSVGISEQVTDMGEVLKVWPNPVGAGEALQVEVLLPECRGCRLSVVTADGRLVQQRALLPLPGRGVGGEAFEIAAPSSPGAYFLHLTDGNSWLAGTKVVVQ